MVKVSTYPLLYYLLLFLFLYLFTFFIRYHKEAEEIVASLPNGDVGGQREGQGKGKAQAEAD